MTHGRKNIGPWSRVEAQERLTKEEEIKLARLIKKWFFEQKSSIGENWPVAGRLTSGSSAGSGSSDVSMKYIVYKQPLSLDRFFIHEVC